MGKRKRCSKVGCTKGALKGGKCITHGGGNRCQEPACDKSAQGSTDRCKGHGGGNRCQEPGCDKSAVGSTDRCIATGGGNRCQEPGCDKGAEGSTGRCVTHGGGNRCQEPGCDKSARSGSTGRCKGHGGGNRCQEPGCDKSAQGSTDRCKGHGGGNRCQEPGCDKSAAGSTDRCVAHGGGNRCQELGCDKSARSGSTDRCVAHGGGNRCVKCALVSAQAKHNFLCVHCDEERSREHCVQERAVLAFLLAARKDGRLLQTFKYNAPFGKLALRPDFLFGERLVVEVDEHQHKGYTEEAEKGRVRAITAEAQLPMVFLRFNPDSYRMNGVKQHISIKDRHEMLLTRILHHLSISLEERNRLQTARLIKMGEPVTEQNLRQHYTIERMYYDNLQKDTAAAYT